MLLYIFIPVLAFLTGTYCQNQFYNPPPRQERDPAVTWHLGSVAKVIWVTTSSNFSLFCRSESTDHKDDSIQRFQLFDPSVDPNAHYQPTSPYGFKIDLSLNASLGAFYFQFVDSNGNGFSSDSFVIIESFGNDFSASISSTPTNIFGNQTATTTVTTSAGGPIITPSSVYQPPPWSSQGTIARLHTAASSTTTASTAAAPSVSGIPGSAVIGFAIGLGLAL